MATSYVVSRYRSHRLFNRRRANVSVSTGHRWSYLATDAAHSSRTCKAPPAVVAIGGNVVSTRNAPVQILDQSEERARCSAE